MLHCCVHWVVCTGPIHSIVRADLGYNAPGYRNADLHTPALDDLAKGGLILEEYYVFSTVTHPAAAMGTASQRQFAPFTRASILATLNCLSAGVLLPDIVYCAPSRGAFHTGRFPFHLDAVEKNLIPW